MGDIAIVIPTVIIGGVIVAVVSVAVLLVYIKRRRKSTAISMQPNAAFAPETSTSRKSESDMKTEYDATYLL